MTIQSQAILPEGGKARRVYLLLSEGIARGTYAVGTRLPGEHRLAAEFGVSRVTVRRALDALAADGWIEKRTGAGSVVLRHQAQSRLIAADFATLMPQLVDMERQTTVRLLSFDRGKAPPSVAEQLGLAEDGQVQTAVRVRLLDGRPFSHLTTHVPEHIACQYTEADLAALPLFRLLERSGVRVAQAHQSVTATLATPDVAEALDMPAGAPLLALQRVVHDANGAGVEVLAALYRPDLFRLEMSLSRVGTGQTRHWEPVIGEDTA